MGRVFACSDLHGIYYLWRAIKTYLKPDDKLFYLGDAIDRGIDGIQILLEMAHDSRVTFVKGNHEELMLREIVSDKKMISFGSLWAQNGGMITKEHYMKLPATQQQLLIDYIDSAPIEAWYTSKSKKNNSFNARRNHSRHHQKYRREKR